MRDKKFSELEYGDSIADMHGKSFRALSDKDFWIDEEVELFDCVEFDGNEFWRFLQNTVRDKCGKSFTYLNKLLIVLDLDYRSDNNPSPYIVAYSYDGRRCGIAKLRRKME